MYEELCLRAALVDVRIEALGQRFPEILCRADEIRRRYSGLRVASPAREYMLVGELEELADAFQARASSR